jgi:hypothetical protein
MSIRFVVTQGFDQLSEIPKLLFQCVDLKALPLNESATGRIQGGKCLRPDIPRLIWETNRH